jgi:large subunit ribosomal protein L1
VVRSVEDLPGVLREIKGGRLEFRNDRLGIVHLPIGKKSFTEEAIKENLYALVDAVQRAKPAGAKGIYCRTISIASTMGPGISLDVPATLSGATSVAS